MGEGLGRVGFWRRRGGVESLVVSLSDPTGVGYGSRFVAGSYLPLLGLCCALFPFLFFGLRLLGGAVEVLESS